MASVERLEGSGMLEPEGGGEAKRVNYSIAIVRPTVSRPGLPPATGPPHDRCRISASDGSHLPEGLYRLTLEDGRRVPIRNLGFNAWHIEAG
jgi:hypothetical protein